LTSEAGQAAFVYRPDLIGFYPGIFSQTGYFLENENFEWILFLGRLARDGKNGNGLGKPYCSVELDST
jgi:hypothetical protein